MGGREGEGGREVRGGWWDSSLASSRLMLTDLLCAEAALNFELRSSDFANFFAGKVDVSSLVSGELNHENPSSPTHLPHPLMTMESASSLLVSTVCTLTGLGACPLDSKLSDLGLNSFDVVRIANQLEEELGAIWRSHDSCLRSHDSRMTLLVEKLLDSKVGCVAEYITTEMEAMSERRGAKRLPTQDSSLDFSTKKARPSDGGGEEVHSSHMTCNRSHMTSVESWRRGQGFLNGK